MFVATLPIHQIGGVRPSPADSQVPVSRKNGDPMKMGTPGSSTSEVAHTMGWNKLNSEKFSK